MTISEDPLVERLASELGLSREEAALYVRSLREKVIKDGRSSEAIKALHSRGMVILASNGRDYVPVHPRLALSNQFRAYEENLLRQRKEKRLIIDRLTHELIPIYEESKGTNSAGERGRSG